MFQLMIAAGVVLSVFGVCEANVPPAGKCKNVTPIPVDFNTLTHRFKKWQLLYVPDDDTFIDTEKEFRDEFSISDNVVKIVSTIKEKNSSVTPYMLTLTYGDDHIIYETAEEFNGEISLFKWFPLRITNQSAGLYYRCSDTGSLSIDTRYIVIPRGNKLSAADEQKLLDADKSCHFEGGIRKLENAEK